MADEGGGRGRGAGDAEGVARGPPRPARPGRAAGARARRGRGRGLPPRRRAGARPGGDAGDAAPGRARAPRADPPREGAVRGRGRLPLPPPADPRRRLRRAPESHAGGAARALRRLAGAARDGAGRAGRDPRLPPRAGRPLQAGARPTRRDPGRARRRAARGRRPPRALARRRPGRRRAARAGARADPAGAARRRCSSSTSPRRSPIGTARRPQRSPTPPPSGRGQPATKPASCSPASAPPTTARSSRPIRQSTSWSSSRGRRCRCSSRRRTTPAWRYVWDALGYGVANWRGRFEDWAHAAEQALRHARLAGQAQLGPLLPRSALVYGPRPADEALRTLDALLPENPHPWLLLCRAWLLTMLARFDEAAQIAREAGDRLRDLTGDDDGRRSARPDRGDRRPPRGRGRPPPPLLRPARGPRPARLPLRPTRRCWAARSACSDATTRPSRSPNSAASSASEQDDLGRRRSGGRCKRSSTPAAASTSRRSELAREAVAISGAHGRD